VSIWWTGAIVLTGGLRARVVDFRLDERLDFPLQGGIIGFGGERAVVLSTTVVRHSATARPLRGKAG
jgi:hypothetical protein